MAKQRIINHHPPKQLQLSEASQSNQILLEKRKKEEDATLEGKKHVWIETPEESSQREKREASKINLN